MIPGGTATRHDPAAQRWLLGGEVAAIRTRSQMSMAKLAAAAKVTKPKLGELERGAYNLPADLLEHILRCCNATDEEIVRLRALANQPTGKPWWHPWRSAVADWFELFLGLEGMASQLDTYEQSAVPGLLHTPEYAQAVTKAASMVRPADMESHIELRMERARRVEEGALQYRVIVEESALMRTPRDTSIMMRQLDHLAAVSEHPMVDIRLLPTNRELHPAMTVPNYVLFGFEGLSSVGYSEAFGHARYVRVHEQLRAYRTAAGHLSKVAMSQAQTRDALLRLRRNL